MPSPKIYEFIDERTDTLELLVYVSNIIDQAIDICGSDLNSNGEALPSVLDYVEAFSGDADFRAQQKADFLSGKIDNPVLNEYTNLGDNFERRKKAFNELRILQNTLESLLVELKDRKNDENYDEENQKIILEINLGIDLIKRYKSIIASMQGAYLLSLPNPKIGPKRKLLNSNSALISELPTDISEWMSEAYFQPSSTVTQQILNQVDLGNLVSESLLESEKQGKIADLSELFVPNKAMLDYYGALLNDKFGVIFERASIERDSEYVLEEQKTKIENVLSELKLDDSARGEDKGWKVVIDLTKTGFSIENSEKIFRIGKRGKDNKINGLDFQAKLVHELMHLLRYQNAEDNGYPAIAKKGLPGYLDFEEAFGGFLESCWKGEYKPDVYEYRYLAGAYAQGKVDGKYHDFKSCFDFVFNYAKKKNPSTEDDEIQSLKSTVYDAVLRFFRGMPLGQSGANDFSGFTYLAGVNSVGKVLVTQKESGEEYLEENDFWNLWEIKNDPSKSQDIEFAMLLGAATRRVMG